MVCVYVHSNERGAHTEKGGESIEYRCTYVSVSDSSLRLHRGTTYCRGMDLRTAVRLSVLRDSGSNLSSILAQLHHQVPVPGI